MILVEAPDHASIGVFIHAVGDNYGHVYVVAEMDALLALPAGSLVALCPRAEDAAWLNLKRPLIVERSLRLLIWAEHKLAGVLHEEAPDFFDWISHHQECPPTPVEFALRGLKRALAEPGIVWGGSPAELSTLLREVDPEAAVTTISADLGYQHILGSIRDAGDAWILWTDVHSLFRVRRVRWALAECGRFGRSALTGWAAPWWGWQPLHAMRAGLHELVPRLHRLGIPEPARVAVIAGLDVDLLVIADVLGKMNPVPPEVLLALRDDDPTAALAADMQVPLAASFRSRSPRLISRHRARSLRRELRHHQTVDANELAIVAARASWSSPMPSAEQSPLVRGWLVEALLRGAPRTASTWVAFTRVAGALGDRDVQLIWSGHALTEAASLTPEELTQAIDAQHEAIRGLGGRELVDFVLEITKEGAGEEPSLIAAHMLRRHAEFLADEGRLRDAERLLRRALEITANAKEDDGSHLERLAILEALTDVLIELGNEREAAIVERNIEAIEANTTTDSHVGDEDVDVDVDVDDERIEDEGELRTSIQLAIANLGPEHPRVLEQILDLAEFVAADGRSEEAEALLRDLERRRGAALSFDVEMFASIDLALIDVLVAQGKDAEAAQTFRRTRAAIADYAGPEHPAYFHFVHHYADLLINKANYVSAEKLLSTLARVALKSFGASSSAYRDVLLALVEVMIEQGRVDDAEKALLNLVRKLRREGVKDNEFQIQAALLHARVGLRRGQFADAEARLRRLLGQVRRLPWDEWSDEHLAVLEALIDLLVGLARHAEAVELYRQEIAERPALAEVVGERLERLEARLRRSTTSE